MFRAYAGAWRQSFQLDGRTSRGDYLKFYIVLCLLMIAATTVVVVLGGGRGMILGVLGLIVLLHMPPWVALSVRRLHDLNYSGWWLVLNFVPLQNLGLWWALLMWKSTAGRPNRFGPSPHAKAAPPSPWARTEPSRSEPPLPHQGEPSLAQPPAKVGEVVMTSEPRPIREPAVADDPIATPSSVSTDLIERLERLARLKQEGALDEEDFLALKSRLLDRSEVSK